MENIEKKCFKIDNFHFEEANVSLPIQVGYETYGKLNSEKNNTIMLCHYFTGNSHAAGKYAPTDAAPGWWDAIIGPGKAIDTDKFFVICADSICNINFNNPKVYTTGPGTINPKTGKPYAMDFPIFTLNDVVKSHKMLLDNLGISSLKAVIGPSMGGLQSFIWGKYYPDVVQKVVSVFATPMMRPWTLMVPNQLAIDSITLDPDWNGGNYYGGKVPNTGLLLAFKVLLMATRTDEWAELNFGRRIVEDGPSPYKSLDGKFLVQHEVEKIVLGRMQFFDPNGFLYIAKANTLFDLRSGNESLKDALSAIKAPTLMVIDESDLLFTRGQAEEALKYLPKAEMHCYNSHNGHLSCIFETGYFGEKLKSFLG
ncbi:MAG: homoserine O-acetyltransferase [Candidatus Riflebacteria bacterium]|nr:homoserine O-acetyltransferase [Candidatus Riflebacteria bacterium]